jgi:nicotinamide riboside kinase
MFTQQLDTFYKANDAKNVLQTCETSAQVIVDSIVPTQQIINTIQKWCSNEIILSVNCGTGLLEWILNESLPQITVYGTGKSNKYITPTQFIMKKDTCTHIPNITTLLFYYCNNTLILEEYMLTYPSVNTIIIIGTNDENTTPNVNALCSNKDWARVEKIPVTGIHENSALVIYKRVKAKRVLIIGAESTGKSTLTENLAKLFRDLSYSAIGIQEWAREWIDNELDGDMDHLAGEHITLFGTTQMDLVNTAATGEYDIIFSDTDAIVSGIFQKIYFDYVDPVLEETIKNEMWDLVLLTHVDVQWVDDGQRNLSHRREEIHKTFEDRLKELKIEYVDVKGTWEERLKTATNNCLKLM